MQTSWRSLWKPAGVIFLSVFQVLLITTSLGANGQSISLISDSSPGLPVQHGTRKLTLALKEKGFECETVRNWDAAKSETVIIFGLTRSDETAAKWYNESDLPRIEAPESLLVHPMEREGKKVLLVVGADERGLMYALLDLADRIGWSQSGVDPLSEVENLIEKPAVVERALSKYTMQQAYFESFFFDERYWAKYFDTLAANRFNTFALIFGYENGGYFAPPYPYFFTVPEYPDVRVIGFSQEDQDRYLKALNRLIEMAHERGIDFTVGIWDHIYRGGVQGGGPKDANEKVNRPTPGLVWGLSKENLFSYSVAALAKFLEKTPQLDAIQFRMHGESGLKKGEMDEFWTNIYRVILDCGKEIRFDARAKNFPDSLIDKALDMGVDMRICTKYWMEQMGLPFHPTHIHPKNQFDRRHGYADLLRYPQRYKMHWRLWNGGTSRVLLWGDPEYGRRFAESTHLYGGEGFEVNEPLATKMEAQPHDLAPFELLGPEHRYYEWEFERYWHFYQVFGRLGYNPETSPKVWRREFEHRFGKEAAPHLEKALHTASKILPRAVAYCYPYRRFPTTRGWVGKQRQEDLPVYANSLPSDTEQFLGPAQAARNHLEGIDSARIGPKESHRWFARTASEVQRQVLEAENRVGERRGKEFDSTITDLKILAHLASYHSERIMAGFHYALFQISRDLNALDEAIVYEKKAIAAWERIVEAAGDVYAEDLMLGYRGSGLCGHWRDELVELNKGLNDLDNERRISPKEQPGAETFVAHVPTRKIMPGVDLILKSTVYTSNPIHSVRVRYGSDEQTSVYIDMERVEPLLYKVAIPAERVKKDFMYFFEITRSSDDSSNDPTGSPRKTQTEPIRVIVTPDGDPPRVVHRPLVTAAAGEDALLTALVEDPSGVRWVRLRYRCVNQHLDYATLPMLASDGADRYQVTIPGEELKEGWDFMYFVEAMDEKGNGRIYPDLKKETPYVIVKLKR